jgi:hypothetical protein
MELEATYADLNCEKDSMTTSYRWLSEKHKAHNKKAKQDKTKLVEAHAVRKNFMDIWI